MSKPSKQSCQATGMHTGFWEWTLDLSAYVGRGWLWGEAGQVSEKFPQGENEPVSVLVLVSR